MEESELVAQAWVPAAASGFAAVMDAAETEKAIQANICHWSSLGPGRGSIRQTN